MAIEIPITPDIREPVSGISVKLKPAIFYDHDMGVIVYTVEEGQDIFTKGEHTVDFRIDTATLPGNDKEAGETAQAMVVKFIRREITRMIFEGRGTRTQ